ncbi:hypothetical protein WICMUC_000454 [Wickerhamomyces mucosus]|uniref:Glutathione S-transferase n=1 Tax=Wickerhamomyces mucosus TaxID=1378264 RepID=A0A9P8PY07_9ASCO|nr:hypothetical protein WICMUC_000454 [Wickerhamomyces mucosus]
MPHTYITNHENLPNGINLFTSPTPNGYKAVIYLESLKIDYNVYAVDLLTDEQKSKWFLDFNLNGRIPVLIYVENNKIKHVIPESGAILLFIGKKFDTENKHYYGESHELYYNQLSWLFFQTSHVGPMQGQLHHFGKFSEIKEEYAIKRFNTEVHRLYQILENLLIKNGNGVFIGDRYTIVDFAIWPWVFRKHFAKIDLNDYPNIKAWFEKLETQNFLQTAIKIPPRIAPLD